MKIYPAVQQLLVGDTDRQTADLISILSFLEGMIKKTTTMGTNNLHIGYDVQHLNMKTGSLKHYALSLNFIESGYCQSDL
jgi:hypothetical protein